MLQDNEVILINEMIAEIYTAGDTTLLRKDFLEQLRMIIPFKVGTYSLASGDERLLKESVAIGLSPEDMNSFQKYVDRYAREDFSRFIFANGKSMVFRETDVFSDVIRKQYAVYNEFYAPRNLYYCIDMSISCAGEFLGIVSLYREEKDRNFSDRELDIVRLFLPHFEYRLYREKYIGGTGVAANSKVIKMGDFDYITKYGLTLREMEVLKMLMTDVTMQEISEGLSIMESTLKKHANNIYRKLGINHRWELLKFK